MDINIKRHCIILIFLSAFNILYAQQPAEELSFYAQKYPKENAVTLSFTNEAEITVEKGKIEIIEHIHEERLLLNDNFNLFAQGKVYYSSFSLLSDLTAYTLVPNGRHYSKVNVTDFRDVKNFGNSVFYDDQGEKDFAYPGLVKGAKLVLDYSLRQTEPHFFNSIVFTDNIPVEKTQYLLHCPADMKITHKYYGPFASGIQYSEEPGHRSSTYTWKMENLAKYIPEDDVPFLKYVTHMVLLIDSYVDNGKRVNFLSSVDDLYAWYVKLFKDVDYSLDKSILRTVDSLTQNCHTEEEKVKALYYWNQDNIKYIAFEEGYNGYVPRNPVDVFSKRYGDCKDKAMLLFKMLGAAGVRSYMTWIGTSTLPYRFSELPSPLNCNHVIVTWYDAKGKPVFLDATATFLPLGIPNEFFQGKEALVGISDTSWRILTVPEVKSDENHYRDSVLVNIDGASLKGHGQFRSESYIKSRMMNQLTDLDYEKTIKYCTTNLSKGNNKCRIDTAIIDRPFFRDKELLIKYRFTIPDYLHREKDEIYVNLNLDKPFTNATIKLQQKKFNLENTYQIHTENIVALEVPEGYEVEHLPPDITTDNDIMNISAKYELKNKLVLYRHNIEFKFMNLPTGKFGEFNDLIRQLNQTYIQTIILRKK